jgi:DNA repair ATPase RecN
MPRLCTNCGETKSKSLFIKGRILCKQCEENVQEISRRAPQEVDALQILTTENLLCTLQELSTKMDVELPKILDAQKKLAEMDNSLMMQDVLTTLTNVHEVLQNVPKRMDELQRTLDALQDVPRKLEDVQERLEILENLFARDVRLVSSAPKPPSVAESVEESDDERIPLRCIVG